MADIFTKKQRSYVMSRIRSKDTKPEMLVRKFLFASGFRYRTNDKKLPGSPDIVLKKYNTVIFIHGCFWHGHKNCKYVSIPKIKYWIEKIERNQKRDKSSKRKLKSMGWKVIDCHECKLKKDKVENTLNNILHKILSD